VTVTPAFRPDRLRQLIDDIAASIDDDVDGAAIAARSHFSRYHFDRLVSGALGESPVAFRRRLLLERAAWRLRYDTITVTDAGTEAGYESTEGFIRAFARAYGAPPGRFREDGGGLRRPAPNDVHFHPPAGLFVRGRTQEVTVMDLTDRLVEHDLWLTRRLIDRAGTLQPEDLDRDLSVVGERMTFDAEQPTVRAMLHRLVWTKENWNASVAGRAAPAEADTSIAALRRRWDTAGSEFANLAREIRDRGDWDSGFVDALCDPPERFTFGGMLAHVITYSAYRRQVLIKALGQLGVDDVGIGDPKRM
jgi:AraC-like DNA-binding protein